MPKIIVDWEFNYNEQKFIELKLYYLQIFEKKKNHKKCLNASKFF